ncbi:thioredoxin family protein [Pedobacter foliorum]|uniref:thioredoxin family protein n=1 Tax=Pedobacter foliorum TaxID=2739058 RepID=UPI001566F9A9|nr:thioredoxin family protein [Pedobacter foliorum]NRF41287.1 thioredoxin family protein [Pedobacter foliorum]
MKTGAQHINKQIEDPSTGEMILINACTREVIRAFPTMKEKYDIEYPDYTPEPNALNDLLPLLKDKNITIVLGTWCGDSREQLPHFLKTIDSSSFAEENITFICVDRAKETEDELLNDLNIDRVPTFIIYHNREELGRIIEKPTISIEEDMVLILSKN